MAREADDRREVVIRATRAVRDVDDLALVLAATGIPHRVEPGEPGWMLLVPVAALRAAEAALEAYERELPRERPEAVPDGASRAVAWTVGLLSGALLLAFFVLTGPADGGSRWFDRGAASASRILGGEPWRAVTALTLHVDAVHVSGNAVATALLLAAVVARLGPGLGLALTLLAGSGANVIEAVVNSPRHVSVGASTATFGAIGILVGLQLTRGRAGHRTRPWVVLVTSVLLLATLGTARGADILGHGLGLATGGAVGFAGGIWVRRPLRPLTELALLALSAAVILGAWHLALGRVA